MNKSNLSYGNIIKVSLNNSPNETTHWHDNLEIILAVKGSTKIQVSFEKIELNENQIMVINSAEPHRIYDSSDDSEIMSVKLNIDYCYSIHGELYEAFAVSDYDVTFTNLNENKELIISNIYSIVKLLSDIDEINEANSEAVYEKIKTLINNLVASYMPKLSSEYLTKKVPEEKLEMIYRMIRYLYENYDRKVNLQEFADQEYLNLYYISHSIKDITGTSFRDWLNYVRVEQSEKLLLNTDKSITAIADKCGFSDVRYYNKHFYKWHNVTPSGFRRIFKKSYAATKNKDGSSDVRPVVFGNDITKLFLPKEGGEYSQKNLSYVHINLNEKNGPGKKAVSEKLVSGRIECDEDQLIEPMEWENIIKIKEDMNLQRLYIHINLYEKYLGLSHSEIRNFVKGINFLSQNDIMPILCVAITDDLDLCINEIQKILKSLIKNQVPIKVYQLEVEVDMEDTGHNEKIKIYKTFRNEIIKIFPDIKLKNIEPDQQIQERQSIRNVVEAPIRMSEMISPRGLKTNRYNFRSLLIGAKRNIICEENDYIVCGDQNRINIFIYQNASEKLHRQMAYHIYINGADCAYKVINYKQLLSDYELNKVAGNMKIIESLTEEEKKLFNRMMYPKVSFDYLDKSDNQELTFQVEDNCFIFYDLIRV